MKAWCVMRATGLTLLSLVLLLFAGAYLICANSFGLVRSVWREFYWQCPPVPPGGRSTGGK